MIRRPPRPHPVEEEDAAYRAAWGVSGRRPWGRGLRAAFYEDLPDPPTNGRDAAGRYLATLQEVRERQCWTPHEQERLRVLIRRWEKRARGEDERYAALGVVGGVNEKYRHKGGMDTLQQIKRTLG